MVAQYGGLTRIEYVFWDEISDFGTANAQLQWLGGIQLKTGCVWKTLNSTVYGHAFRNDLTDGIYTRSVELGDVSDSQSTDYALHQSVNRHFVVKGTGQDGQQWLIASPFAPMTLTMTVVRTVGTVTIWKGTLKGETKEPLFRWIESNANIRYRYSETPVVPSNPVIVAVNVPLPQGSTVSTITALPVGSGRFTVNVRVDAAQATAQLQADEAARLQRIAIENARLAAIATAQSQADAAYQTASQYALQTSAQQALIEKNRLQAEADARAAAEAARLAAEAARQIALADAIRRNADAMTAANVASEAARLQAANQHQALMTAYTQGLAAQSQANAQLVAALATQPKPYASSAAAGAFLLTEPVENQPVTPTVPYVPYTSQIDETA